MTGSLDEQAAAAMVLAIAPEDDTVAGEPPELESVLTRLIVPAALRTWRFF